MAPASSKTTTKLDTVKFQDAATTADGKARASVSLTKLQTLWINTGTLCNLACNRCYIESSPANDRLVYVSAEEVKTFLEEIIRDEHKTEEIGFTGGEPFMNPEIIEMLNLALSLNYRALILTNAMKPMRKVHSDLMALNAKFGDRLVLRVSIDHYTQSQHEKERGKQSWAHAIEGLSWLSQNGFNVRVAGRTIWSETEKGLRAGYSKLFKEHNLKIDPENPIDLVLFPEIDGNADVPEITTECWDILNVSPNAMMCASSRMVVKRRGMVSPVVVPCTLLPYDARFEMGVTLADAATEVPLNHPNCARFCVFGGGSCSQG